MTRRQGHSGMTEVGIGGMGRVTGVWLDTQRCLAGPSAPRKIHSSSPPASCHPAERFTLAPFQGRVTADLSSGHWDLSSLLCASWEGCLCLLVELCGQDSGSRARPGGWGHALGKPGRVWSWKGHGPCGSGSGHSALGYFPPDSLK